MLRHTIMSVLLVLSSVQTRVEAIIKAWAADKTHQETVPASVKKAFADLGDDGGWKRVILCTSQTAFCSWLEADKAAAALTSSTPAGKNFQKQKATFVLLHGMYPLSVSMSNCKIDLYGIVDQHRRVELVASDVDLPLLQVDAASRVRLHNLCISRNSSQSQSERPLMGLAGASCVSMSKIRHARDIGWSSGWGNGSRHLLCPPRLQLDQLLWLHQDDSGIAAGCSEAWRHWHHWQRHHYSGQFQIWWSARCFAGYQCGSNAWEPVTDCQFHSADCRVTRGLLCSHEATCPSCSQFPTIGPIGMLFQVSEGLFGRALRHRCRVGSGPLWCRCPRASHCMPHKVWLGCVTTTTSPGRCPHRYGHGQLLWDDNWGANWHRQCQSWKWLSKAGGQN